jgi:drug/metabolite transporter (DMT)-like permease
MLHRSSVRKTFFSRQEAALIGITLIWGFTFLIVHLAVGHAGPLFFVGLRFVAAGLLTTVMCRGALLGLTKKELLAGSAIGVTIFLGYGLQTYGLQSISSSTSAFLTALYVPMVPLIQWLVMRRPPRALTWAGIALAFVGLILLAGPDAWHVGVGSGEAATLLSAAAIAAEIILIGRFASEVDSSRVTVVQLLVGGLLSFAAMPIVGENIPAFSWIWLLAGLGLGIASAIIQLTMNWAQKSVSPTRATIIYASEPVWAGIVGRIAGDRLPPLVILGAAFIIAGVIVSELKPRRRSHGEASAK